VCQKEGNTYVSGGRACIPFLLTHMYSPPPDTPVFPSC
jgi:hypothetical protein